MIKSAKLFVLLSLVYGTVMFLIIWSFHVEESLQEENNMKPASTFLTVQENKPNFQDPNELNITVDEGKVDNTQSSESEAETEFEVATFEDAENVPEGTLEDAIDSPAETTEFNTTVPDETVKNVTVASNEADENTTVVPDETIEAAPIVPDETVGNVTAVPDDAVKNATAAPKEADENTTVIPDETIEANSTVPEKTVESVAVVPDEPIENVASNRTDENTTVVPDEAIEAAPIVPDETVESVTGDQNTTVVPDETIEANTTVPNETAENVTVDQNTTVVPDETVESAAAVPDESVENVTAASNRTVEYGTFSFKYNPFNLLGAYPDPTPYLPGVAYDTPHFGLINNDDYCNQVDHYNLEHPENMFEKMNFYTDFPKKTLMRKHVMRKLGKLFNINVDRKMSPEKQKTRSYQYKTEITTFHITGDVYYMFHEIGKHFVCATQMFSHIPNHTDLLHKDHFPQSFQNYKLKYHDRPQCYEKHILFPETFRLFDKNECEEFFEILHTRKYKNSLEGDPIQYILKIGHDAHKAEGVFLVDKHATGVINTWFDHGYGCGQVDNYFIVQRYITNPMLLDNNNKFHMRVYVLIASTNPLIAYYHDGYLRASIFPFVKSSENRAAHLTNLLTGDKFADAVQTSVSNNETNGMTAKELEDYYLWTFEDLGNYLYESKKTNDSNWVDNYLRPSLKKAFVHVLRMTSGPFWKQSNVYEMLGCDFILDDKMNLWFIEANANPLLDGVLKERMIQMLKDLFEIEYAYYRSRMKRVLAVLQQMQEKAGDEPPEDLDKWREKYQEAVKNRLEPEYKISETSSWKMIINENLSGAEAYFGHIPEECL